MRVPRKLWYIAAGIFLAFLLVYSGWLWKMMRPMLHKDIINKYAGEYKFDPLFVMALVKVESNFSRTARSHRGAIGLMQLLPSTANEMAEELGMDDLSLEDLEKPEINIRLGYHYLAKLRALTGGDVVQMLSAYNAGYQNMLNWKTDNNTLRVADIGFKETRDFVGKVITTHETLKKFQKVKKIIEWD